MKKLINVVIFVLAIMLCGNNLAFASVGGANDKCYINCGKTDQVRFIIVSRGDDVILEGLEGDRSSVQEVTIPKNVTKIGNGAFENCVNLRKVNFEGGSNLLVIDQRAFYNCRSLSQNRDTRMTLPRNVRYIGNRAFEGCGAIYIYTNSQNLVIESENVFDDIQNVDWDINVKEMLMEFFGTGDSPMLNSLSIIMREKFLQEYRDVMRRYDLTEEDLMKLLWEDLNRDRYN